MKNLVYSVIRLPMRCCLSVRHLLVLLGLYSLCSCGLVDIDVDEVSEVAQQFSLKRDTVYLMEGETYVFQPVFTPDTLSNKQVFYVSQYDTVLVMRGDTVVPRGEGWAKVVATSVSSRIADSCQVCVLPQWAPSLKVYPYETIVFASVTMKGRAMDDKMTVTAFCGDEVRAVGQIVEENGLRFMLFRVGSTLSDQPEESEPDDEDDGVYKPLQERIVFRCYDRQTHDCSTSKTRLLFNGETHGSPSSLINLKFE